jgi:hypothetical protein
MTEMLFMRPPARTRALGMNQKMEKYKRRDRMEWGG